MPSNTPPPRGITSLDVRIGASVLVCCLTATALDAAGVKFPVGEMRLDVIQELTACISCLLCCQDGIDESRHAGVVRVLITAIGGLVGMGVVALDLLLGENAWLLALLVGLGVVVTLLLCKLVGVPYVNARIGGVTFVLVSCTLNGTARLWYAGFRLLSTLFGAVVVLLVTWAFERAKARRSRDDVA